MYAQISVWQLSEAGESPSNAAAREVAEALRAEPGFRSYTLVRTGAHEVTSVLLFEEVEQLDAALAKIRDVVQQHVAPLTAGEPERRRGDVVYHVSVARETVVERRGSGAHAA